MDNRNLKIIGLLALIVILMITVTVSGCTTQQTPASNTTVTPIPSQQTTTVTDMLGRTVVVPYNITRIITYNAVPPLNSLLMVFGKGNDIINNIPSSMATMPEASFQYVLDPQLANEPQLDATPNVEQILSMNPDVVITSEESTVTALQNSTIPVICLENNDSEISQIEESMNILGQIFHNPARANEYIQYYNSKIAQLNATIGSVPMSQRPKVLNMWATTLAVFNASYWIAPAGGIDAFSSSGVTGGYGGVTGRYQVTMEELLQWNPDIIIVRDAGDISYLENNSQFSTINAVKNKQIYVEPAGTFTWNGAAETPLMSEWAASVFYPNLVSQSQVINDTIGFYKEFLGYNLSVQQADEMLHGMQNETYSTPYVTPAP